MSDSFDPWQIPADGATPFAGQAEVPTVQVDVIEGIEPLDTQTGIFPKRTVPEALRKVLFGQPVPTTAEVEATGGDISTTPPMRTYAILDASKVVGLSDLLENSGLEHRCLFKGKAYEEMKDVAPWLVRLEEDGTLTRNLLTQSDAYWHLWDKEPGIFIRSHHHLDRLWRHFRKFTRLQDGANRWYYFPFWQAMLVHNFCMLKSNDTDFLKHFLPNGTIISFDIILNRAYTIKKNNLENSSVGYRFKLSEKDFELLRIHKASRDSRKIGKSMWTGSGNWSAQKDMSLEACIKNIERAMMSARKCGLTHKEHALRFIALCEELNEIISKNSSHKSIRKTLSGNHASGRVIANLGYDVMEVLKGQPVYD